MSLTPKILQTSVKFYLSDTETVWNDTATITLHWWTYSGQQCIQHVL